MPLYYVQCRYYGIRFYRGSEALIGRGGGAIARTKA